MTDHAAHDDAPRSAEETHHLEQQRRTNRDAVAALGVNPYGERTDNLMPLAEVRARYNEQADLDHQANAKTEGFTDARPVVRIAGRVMLHRDNGKLVWMQLRDDSVCLGARPDAPPPDLQIAVSKKDCDETGFEIAKRTDLGDLVIAEGPVMRTKAGEITVWASSLRPGAKSLALPPEKRAGLQDTEQRYRRRYVDLYTNPETMRVLAARSRLVRAARDFLDARGYSEVETPMLQTLAGGAAARPFVTHMNALDISLFMRIAPELYLKRLLVGGMPRVYEVNRNFRNEGLDRNHNPEFTMLELYHAYGDVETVMDLTENLVRDLARVVAREFHARPDGAPLRLPYDGAEIDYESPFLRVPYPELFERALGFPMTDTQRVREEAKRRKLKHEGLDDALVVNALFEDAAEPTLDPARPTFITDYPAALSPLTRPKRDNPALADRADLFIGGMEIAPHYTELNDPDVQAATFRRQLAGLDDEESTFRNFDEDFINALKVGMPPAGGMGLGVDRLVMLLCDQRSIRDVILFPFMRPEA
ncbi:MAG: lysine--tRNA ligase [Phycisphaerales bacterium]|nr:MAG: lysine--tRNA ligase [Phycisphaerales bacterium]